MLKVKIKKLHPESQIPKYQSLGASGFDLHAIEDVEIKPGQTALIKTGLAVEIPEGYELQVRPRSGISLKTFLRINNSPGTVDSDFRGEVCIIASNTNPCISEFIKLKHQPEEVLTDAVNSNTLYIYKGDRIAQGVICPIQKVEFVEEDLSDTERNNKGYGSSGV